MTVTVESRPGTRRAFSHRFYRWTCPHGHTGRWTCQPDTASEGATRHERWHTDHPELEGNTQ